MTLKGEIPSVLDRYSLLNWKELFLYSECARYVVGSEVYPADIRPFVHLCGSQSAIYKHFITSDQYLFRRSKAFGNFGQRHR